MSIPFVRLVVRTRSFPTLANASIDSVVCRENHPNCRRCHPNLSIFYPLFIPFWSNLFLRLHKGIINLTLPTFNMRLSKRPSLIHLPGHERNRFHVHRPTAARPTKMANRMVMDRTVSIDRRSWQAILASHRLPPIQFMLRNQRWPMNTPFDNHVSPLLTLFNLCNLLTCKCPTALPKTVPSRPWCSVQLLHFNRWTTRLIAIRPQS